MSTSYNHLSLMNKRVAVSEVLQSEQLDEEKKSKLRLAMQARVFAENKLGLTKTNNYTQYVQLDRPYVTYVLRVSPVDKLSAYKWWFPFVGHAPYKGFKTPEQAQQEAKEFPKDKYDTYVRGASAYSTLGWFDDPIFSSHLNYQDHDIVELIIHETVHATIYIKSNADFNERLAVFIGSKGTERYYLEKEGSNSKTLKRIQQENVDKKIFSSFISKELDDLKKWYTTSYKPELKAARLAQIQERFKKNIKAKLKIYSYKRFYSKPLNNAQLLSLKTYVYDQAEFQRVFVKLDEDFNKLIQFCKELEKKDDPEKYLSNFAKS